MLRSYRARTVYDVEAPYLARAVPLMERAVAGLVEVMITHGPASGSVSAFAGRGNNGADTLFAAAALASRRRVVKAVLAFDPQAPDLGVTGEALAAATRAGVEIVDGGDDAAVAGALKARVWVDGLTGLGVDPPLRGKVGAIVAQLCAVRDDREDRVVFAVDLPSGIDVDTGRVPTPVLRADHTVTFGGYKPAQLSPPGAYACGQVHLIDIGIGEGFARQSVAINRVEASDIGRWWPVPGVEDHKYTRGVLGMVTGSNDYPGAALLSAHGALATGVGMLRYLGDVGEVYRSYPEVVTQPGRVQAYVVGSGITGQDSHSAPALADALDEAMTQSLPVVVDAGGLEWVRPGEIGGHKTSYRVVLTPHAGELAHILNRCGHVVTRNEIEDDPLTWLEVAHRVTGATVVLKGNITLIASQDRVFSQADGTPWMATAGTGDVLAGIMGTMLAGWQAHPRSAWPSLGHVVAAAVGLHGLAGRRASRGGPISAGQIANWVPRVIADVLGR
ncbi:MAG TPA: NAD(P)H-hydrate dehydratase [Beutenbergiaceae bacterium]|nr:NAD(P)H-hydrate dehydratase [Beutenbergiaceae bacterium]